MSMSNEPNAVQNTARPLRKVVVGVDGSEHSLAALRWAVHQAAMMNVPLEVVTAWAFPDEPAPLGVEIHVPWHDQLMEQARTRLEQIVADVVPESERSRVTATVISGRPAQVLLKETNEDDLLVVGSRGRGAVELLFLGSVSDHCVRHAPCPVVVVR
jgi:nucleotide-binding universal stress UspA family protein